MSLYTNKYSGTSSLHAHDFIIIGAGAAGLMATAELYEQGFDNILTLEARDRTGGRILTTKHSGDIGAAGFHVPPKSMRESNSIYDRLLEFADRNNIKFLSEHPKLILYRNGHRVDDGQINTAIDKIESLMEKTYRDISHGRLPADISLHDALKKLFDDSICNAIITTQYSNADSGLDAKNVSFTDRYTTMAPTFCVYPEKGMSYFMNRFTHDAKKFVSTRKEVVSIKHDKAKGLQAVTYKDLDSGALNTAYGKEVIITVSIGVLKQWIKNSVIELPQDKVDAIRNIGMGHFCKNVIEMKDKFFDLAQPHDLSNLIISSDRYKRNDIFFIKEPLVTQYVGDKLALDYQKKGDNYALDMSLKILASAGTFGDFMHLRKLVLRNEVSQWDNDKYSLGSYSGTSKNFDDRKTYAKPFGHIHFAGEACGYEDSREQTYVLGALNSGMIAAHEAIRSLNKQMAYRGKFV